MLTSASSVAACCHAAGTAATGLDEGLPVSIGTFPFLPAAVPWGDNILHPALLVLPCSLPCEVKEDESIQDDAEPVELVECINRRKAASHDSSPVVGSLCRRLRCVGFASPVTIWQCVRFDVESACASTSCSAFLNHCASQGTCLDRREENGEELCSAG